jgi:hypothetical protein
MDTIWLYLQILAYPILAQHVHLVTQHAMHAQGELLHHVYHAQMVITYHQINVQLVIQLAKPVKQIPLIV